MKYVDDRTKEQKTTHQVIVAATDSALSGWGEAEGGVSYCGWACLPEDVPEMEKWVRARPEMKRVRIVGSNWRPTGHGHCHIYVATEKHRAFN